MIGSLVHRPHEAIRVTPDNLRKPFYEGLMEVKQICLATDFYIREDGVITDKKNNVRNTYTNGDGYITVAVKTNEGVWRTYGLHRLLALTFITNDRLDRTEVNHRDGDKLNNRIYNLEWVTPRENVIHSELIRSDRIFKSLILTENNIPIKEYSSLKEASEDTLLDQLEIWDLLKDGKTKDGKGFIYRGRLEPKPTNLYIRTCGFRKRRSIKVLDTETGDVEVFNSITEAANKFKLRTSHFTAVIPRYGELRLLSKRYMVQYEELDFPEVTYEEIQAAKVGSKEVYAYDGKNNTFYFFISASEFIRQTGLSKKSITFNLAKDRIKEYSGWVFLYASNENIKRLRSYVTGLKM